MRCLGLDYTSFSSSSLLNDLRCIRKRLAHESKRSQRGPSCSATTFSAGWVNRTNEVSTSGRPGIHVERQSGDNYNASRSNGTRQSSRNGSQRRRDKQQERARKPPGDAGRRQRTSSARTVEDLALVLGDASTWDAAALVSGLLQLVNILRGPRSAGDKIQQLEHPIVPVLMLKAVDMAPTASHTDLVIMMEALAEIDACSANARYLESLHVIAGEFSDRLAQGAAFQASDLCRAIAAISLSKALQKESKGAVSNISAVLEPQLESCRAEDLSTLAAELCNMGLYVQHAPLVRKAVHLALEGAGALSARHLASLAQACGVLGNVPKPHMLILAAQVERVAPQLRPRALVIVLQAFTQYNLAVPGLAMALADTAERQLHTLTPMRLSIALFAFAKLNLKPRPSFAQCVVRETGRRLQLFDARSFSSLLWAFNKMGIRPPTSYLDRASEVMERREIEGLQGHGDRRARLTPRNLSSIIWAFGSFGYAPSRMPFLLDLAEQRLMQCNAQDLANIVCGLAACERPDLATPSLLANAELHACSMMSAFSPQGLSNVLWAFAKLEVRAPKLLEAAGTEIVGRIDSFNPRDMAEALWAFAKLDHTSSPDAVQALVSRMEHILRSGGSWVLRDLVSMVHSLAVLEQPAPTFLEAARQLVQPRLAAASGRDLTDLLWGFAKLGVPTPAAFLDLCTGRVGELSLTLVPRELSTLLWAYGKLQAYPGVEIMETLVMRARLSLDKHSPHGISTIAWACAALLHHPGELLDAIAADIERRPSDYAKPDWTNIIWAFTRLGRSPGRLYAFLADEMEEGRIAVDPKLMSTIIWSLAIFQSFESPLYDDVMRSLKDWKPSSFDAECLRRLFQAQLMASALRRSASVQLPEQFREAARAAWAASAAGDAGERSGMVADVSDSLTRLGLANSRGDVAGNGALKMDICLKLRDQCGRKVAVEILSPHKMTRNTHQPVSRVLYRNACLHAWGYAIVSVPWHEWVALCGSEHSRRAQSAKEDFLLRVLAPVLPDSVAGGEDSDRECVVETGRVLTEIQL
ncbi:g9197 [Coccomyxa elongata]